MNPGSTVVHFHLAVVQATSPLPQDLGQLLCDLQLERTKVCHTAVSSW